MKWLQTILFTTLMSFSAVYADEADAVANMKVSRDEIFKGLEKMKNDGQISAADYEKAKNELSGMNDSQIEGLKQAALGMLKNDPEKAASLRKSPKLDIKEVQKQIQDLSKPNQ